MLVFPNLAIDTSIKYAFVSIFAGQSNMVGFRSDSTLVTGANAHPNYADILYANKQLDDFLGDSNFKPLQHVYDPAGTGWNGTNSHGFGVEMAIGKNIRTDIPNMDNVFIKHSVGGTDLDDDWNPDGTGPQYNTLKTYVDGKLADLVSDGYTVILHNFVWVQGESDSDTLGEANQYKANLLNFIRRVREDFNAPDMRFIIGKTDLNQTPFIYDDTVRAAEEQAASESYNTVAVDTGDLPKVADNVHFTGDALLTLGERMSQPGIFKLY